MRGTHRIYKYMKYNTPLRTFFLAASVVGVWALPSHASITVIEFQDSLTSSSPTGLADQPEDVGVFFSAGDQSGTGLVFDDFMATTTSGTSFTFDLTITAGTGVEEIFVADGLLNGALSELDAGETDGSLFEGGDTITISISDIQGDVTFDGFVNFGTDNSGNGEGFNVNGIDYIRGSVTNGDADPRQGIALPGGILAQNSVDISFIGPSVNLRGVAVQFSSVPEPSSTLLLGLAGVGFLLHRRK